MAPKRSAGASSQGPKAKVARKEVPVDPVDQAVDQVLSAIKRCGVQEEQQKLLLETCPIALRTLALDRNPFASQVFGWAQQLLTEYGNAVAEKEARAKSVVAAVDERRAEAAKVKEAAAATVADSQTKLSAAKEARQQAQDELKARSAELKPALKEKDDAAVVRGKIEAAIAEADVIRDVTLRSNDHDGAALKKLVAKVVAYLKQTGAEACLQTAAQHALSVGAQAGFDWTVLNFVVKHVEGCKAAAVARLAEQQELIVKIDETLVPHTQAVEKLASAKEAEAGAQEALRIAEQGLKEAKAGEGTVEANFMEAEATCASCMEARAELDAVLGHFNFLLTRADKPEVDPTEAPAASPAKEPAQDVPMGPAAVEEVAPAPVAAPEVQAQQIVAEQKSFSGPLLDNQENAPANVLATGVVMAAVEQL
eukprot:CAMPEP_0204390800 /NCGR_PEP_ID=MMETSP0469-20131031/60907_1 /ASSEMBLY_ACC=CAM_ASM_000384 /TAXON_ID=2969 /ORGANISM="Oxyrrhis marina" /LENGTH=423 /DNA_ID=CAMNT_0051384723 /DNA_START=44 /DNA_END=1315 /DNA_ORIENTATION=-